MILGSNEEKRALGNQYAEEGKFLASMKSEKIQQEKKRDVFENQRVQ